MANELTHALFSAAVMALINPLLGMQVIDWNVFLAGMAGMLFNLDRIDVSLGRRSPLGHSVGFALIWLYVIGVVAYIVSLFSGVPTWTCLLFVLALTVGALTHLFLDSLAGREVFGLPNNLRPASWMVKVDGTSDRFWGAWNRVSLPFEVRDSQVNVFSLVTLLVLIAVL